jgi:hypothetical protein
VSYALALLIGIGLAVVVKLRAQLWRDNALRIVLAFLIGLALMVAVQASFAGDLPDPSLTPGLADPALTQAKLCSKTFRTGSVRAVDESTKKAVYAEYGQDPKKAPCPCEVDHLISLEVGGSNDAKNLWPQSYGPGEWNAHVKDVLENLMHKKMCAGEITLKSAQNYLANDWVGSYQKFVGPTPAKKSK